jgi:ribonuclease R
MTARASTEPTLASRIFEVLGQAKRPLKLKEIATGLGVKDDGYPELKETLARMTDEGATYKIKHQRYALPQQINLVVGRLDATRGGAGFVIPDKRDGMLDVFVPQQRLGGAVHRDRVVARIERKKSRGNPEGTIIRILDRARSQVVGALQRGKHFGFVKPDSPLFHFDVYVAQEDLAHAEEGQKVVVEIDDWGDGTKNPEGRITKVLGDPDDPGVDILSIVLSHGLMTDFPPEVEEAAKRLTVDFAAEAKRRLDFRDRLTFTIDPADAKDFDDALSLVPIEGDRFEIGIHIADVSHFVKYDQEIDDEAYERGTSTYLVDRVIPMLPERLSNELCSLVPGEDRLTYSVIVKMDGDAHVHGFDIAETVIRSRHRLTYAEAQAIIQGETPKPEHKDLRFPIQTLRRLAKRLSARRFERGSLDFDLPESRVELDEEGFPIDIKESVRLDSMRLIEEFMLLANEIVARHATKRKVPFLYRVHEQPSQEKLERLREFVGAMGHRLPHGDIQPDDLKRVLAEVRGKPEEELVNTVVLRSMMQARYATENIGHFGLAAEHYTHFTSPIRRYPDLVVHRVLKRLESGERWKDPAEREKASSQLERTAEHASIQERIAERAERDSIELKKVEFMERHIGKRFKGRISGVRSFGFFVRLDEYFVEGLVHAHNLEDDYYEFHENSFALIGRNTGRRFRLADPVVVEVSSVNKQERQIDFALVEGPDGKPGRGEKPKAANATGRRGGSQGAGGPGKSRAPQKKAKRR